MALPARTDVLRSQRRSTVARALALLVAAFVLSLSLSAEAKKKKKKGKTPSSSTKKSTSKEAAPADESESDEGGSDEKASSKKAPDEEEEKPAAKPTPPASEGEGEEAPVKKAPPKKAAKAEPAEGEGTPGGLDALRFDLGGGALFRKLTWNQDGGALAPYTLSPGPEIVVRLEAYPGAFVTDGFAANIGLYGHFDYGIGAESKLPNGMKLTTSYQDFLAGLKVRFPVGMIIPYVAGAYGMQKFHLEPVDPNNTRPNFNYSFARFGAGARVQFTPMVDLDVGGGYVLVLNPGSQTGEVKALYPNVTSNGVDVNVSLGVRFTSLIGVRVGGDFRQYGTSLHWRTGQPGIQAGGSTDRYITAWGGIEIILDAVGGGGEEEAPAKKAPAKAKKAPAPDEEPGVESQSQSQSKDEKASDVE